MGHLRVPLACVLSFASLIAAACGVDDPESAVDGGSRGGDDASEGTDSSRLLDAGGDVPPGDVTVEPTRIDDVLTNPNMGFADFHLGWVCNLPIVR